MESRYAKDDQGLRDKLEAVLALCKSLGISISHEDSQGGFVIENWSESNAEWLRAAADERTDHRTEPRA